jgi:hypothetical protein
LGCPRGADAVALFGHRAEPLQVLPVELEQIKRIKDCSLIMLTTVHQLEVRNPDIITDHRLAIDRGIRLEGRRDSADQRIAVRSVGALALLRKGPQDPVGRCPTPLAQWEENQVRSSALRQSLPASTSSK